VYDAMRALVRQVDKLTQEMVALKLFVAAIPGAEGHAQLAHTALNHSKKKPRREHQGRRIAEAHRVIDELERLANEFAEAARR
jgi:hypothetical protein